MRDPWWLYVIAHAPMVGWTFYCIYLGEGYLQGLTLTLLAFYIWKDWQCDKYKAQATSGDEGGGK